METIKIDLGTYKNSKSTIFTGRPQGEAVREQLCLDKEDHDKRLVVFLVPGDTSSFNPSFYLGLLYKSYKNLGADGFEKKYSFEIVSDNSIISRLINDDLLDGRRSAINSLRTTSIFGAFFKK